MGDGVCVVTDSSCDLPVEELQALGVEVVPLEVHFGLEVYRDGELSPDQFWEKARAGQRATTSQPPVGAFMEVFERMVASGKQVLCVTVTGKHSGTVNAARLAAERFAEAVRVFDSQSMSLGHGFEVLAAAASARAGQSLQEIEATLHDLRDRLRVLIVLDTLENLRLGGRADAFIAVAERMARALNIKVITNVVEGQLRLMGAARSFRGAMKRIMDTVEQLGPLEQLAVVHTRSQARAEEVADRLAELTGLDRARIWVRETGAVLATHAGPGVIGIMAVPALSRR